MRWGLDPEQQMLQDALGGWLARVATPVAVRGWLDSADASGFESALADEGWFALGTAEERGGQGGGLLELALAAEQFARAAVPSSTWMATVLALPALPDEAAESAIEEGQRLALAVRSDAPIAAGELTASDGTVSGEVELVLGGDRADRFVVAAAGRLHLVDAAA